MKSYARCGLLFVLTAALTACGGKHGDGTGTEVGMQPVSFEVARLGGGTESLAAHRGHVVLLDLWATWCPPCREELPELDALAKADPRLVVLAANQGESADVVAKTVREAHLRLPVLLDTQQQYGAAYASVGMPTAVILKADGRIAAVVVGSRDAAQWRDVIAKAIAK